MKRRLSKVERWRAESEDGISVSLLHESTLRYERGGQSLLLVADQAITAEIVLVTKVFIHSGLRWLESSRRLSAREMTFMVHDISDGLLAIGAVPLFLPHPSSALLGLPDEVEYPN